MIPVEKDGRCAVLECSAVKKEFGKIDVHLHMLLTVIPQGHQGPEGPGVFTKLTKYARVMLNAVMNTS